MLPKKNAVSPAHADALAGRIAPIIIAALVLAFALGGGALQSLRCELLAEGGVSIDSRIAGFISTPYWEECFGGPLGAFMPAPISTAEYEAQLEGEDAGIDETASETDASA